MNPSSPNEIEEECIYKAKMQMIRENNEYHSKRFDFFKNKMVIFGLVLFILIGWILVSEIEHGVVKVNTGEIVGWILSSKGSFLFVCLMTYLIVSTAIKKIFKK